MTEFTQDWFTHNIETLRKVLAPLVDKPVKVLEIGCFEGRSTVWLLKNILTSRDSVIHCVDTFKGAMDHTPEMMNGAEDRFLQNTLEWGDRVVLHTQTSMSFLSQQLLSQVDPDSYDLIYVDGSHIAKDVIGDLCMSWPLLKSGGIMVMDDYQWKAPYGEKFKPRIAIDAFLDIFGPELEILVSGYQMIVKKL